MIKTISFDLWDTLIKGNPKGVKKHIYFYENHNPLSKTLEEVKDIVDRIKWTSDRLSESTGITVRSEHIVGNILSDLGVDISRNNDIVPRVISDCKKITLQDNNLPLLYDENTLEVLKWLKGKGFSLIGASNTGFLPASTMESVLSKMGLIPYLKYRFYSDEVGYAKPNRNFFDKIGDRVINSSCNRRFLHVGDNPYADGGYSGVSFIINSNGKSILDLKQHIEFSLNIS